VPAGKASEWVCLKHSGFAGQNANKWWGERTRNLCDDFPATVDEALTKMKQLRTLRKMQIQRDGRFWRILKATEFYPPESDPILAKGAAEESTKRMASTSSRRVYL